MNKEFPLEYAIRNAIVFDISDVSNKDIELSDIDISKVEKDMFVAFYSGYIEKENYGSKTYFTEHPQLSDELIEALPVSYTHLDVYKRQLFTESCLPASILTLDVFGIITSQRRNGS